MKNFLKLFSGTVLILFFSFCMNPNNIAAQTASQLWTNISDNNLISKGERRIIPLKYQTVTTNLAQLSIVLDNAPIQFSEAALNSPYIIELPMPTGGLSKFFITEYSMMEPDLARLYPEIKTYNIKGIDDPYAVGKLDITITGFHAMILTPHGDYFIDPYSVNENEIYISYFKSDLLNKVPFECFTPTELTNDNSFNNNSFIRTGEHLRTYNLACAATGEYTAFHGGTVAAGLNAIVVAINRVNGVFERDFSVRMTLIGNNNLIVYTNAGTDPYSNTNGSAMLSQNQTNLDAVIGSANYHIGHVFSTGGGGIAGLRVVCVGGQKGRGVTGSPSPIGDPFTIDYVAHEIGHQYGGNHTYNGTSCGGTSAATAWEPGSASTIMGYAGICGPDNLQNNSDAYFHIGSVGEITSYTQTGNGSLCPVVTATGNTPPTVTVPAGGFTIPISTPFQLTGSATDLQGQAALTYCWEQFDTGPAGPLNSPSGNAPIFRSFNPATSPTRTFPKTSSLLNNTASLGEILPTYTRSLSFRLAVRDNDISGGGINYGSLAFNVSSTAGPFLVTQPNTAVTWNSNPQTVLWNVANTTALPVNCQFVNIKLSSNGGNTFPVTLSANTPNDGSEVVILPAMVSVQARIKVEAVGNVFFDLSNTNFTVNIATPPVLNLTVLMEGFYDSLANAMVADTLRGYLRNNFAPYSIVDSGKVLLTSAGTGSIFFPNAVNGVNYYIQLKHRNALETWSSSPGQSFTASVLNYDFTIAPSQAFGNNQKQVDVSPPEYAIKAGDVDQNGAVNLDDIILIANNFSLFITGYVSTDLNGDNATNLTDILIGQVNSNAFVVRIIPM